MPGIKNTCYLALAGFFLSGTAWKGWGGVPVKRGLMEAMLSFVISKVNSPPLAASLASRIWSNTQTGWLPGVSGITKRPMAMAG